MGLMGGFFADAAYQNDFVKLVTVNATSTASLPVPQAESNAASANPIASIKWRSVTVTDVTVATGGGAPSTGVAAWFRIDGQAASNGTAPLSPYSATSNSRLVKPGASVVVQRSQITQLNFQNPNAAAVVLMIELGG